MVHAKKTVRKREKRSANEESRTDKEGNRTITNNYVNLYVIVYYWYVFCVI